MWPRSRVRLMTCTSFLVLHPEGAESTQLILCSEIWVEWKLHCHGMGQHSHGQKYQIKRFFKSPDDKIPHSYLRKSQGNLSYLRKSRPRVALPQLGRTPASTVRGEIQSSRISRAILRLYKGQNPGSGAKVWCWPTVRQGVGSRIWLFNWTRQDLKSCFPMTWGV
jgi:hypothetical protein